LTKFLGPIGSVVITFFVTLILNTALNYYASGKGTIGLSQPIEINSARFVVMAIENQSADFLNGIVIEVPITVATTSIVTDPAASVEEIASSPGKQKLLKIGQISPRLVSRLFIPIPNGVSGTAVRVVNREASGVKLRQEDQLESPFRSALLSAFVVAVLYALFMGVFAYYVSRESDALKTISDDLHMKIDELNKRLESVRSDTTRDLLASRVDLEAEQQATKKEHEHLRALLVKQRLLLQARLFDYSKELDFWRNAVKALLLSSGGEKQSAVELTANVTKTLGTHGTKSSNHSYEAIQVAAKWLTESERGEPRHGESDEVNHPK
jgi:hypothetical protein